ncbi:hypothetical protein MRX96_025106 [Rhipicephalus microplus]
MQLCVIWTIPPYQLSISPHATQHRQQREALQRAHPRKKLGAAAKTKQHDATGDVGDTDFVKPPSKKPGAVLRAHKKAPADDSESDPCQLQRRQPRK